MSFTDEYLALQKKKKKEEQKTTGHSFTDKYLSEQTEKTVEDIAPVFVNKTAALYGVEREIAPTKKDERKWFEKGAFEDGYQFGDISKTILGTGTDIKEDLFAGVLGMGEKVVDAGAYLVGGAAGLLGADKFKDKTADFIKKDLYNEEKVAKKIIGVSASGVFNETVGIDTEEDSVLGAKSDALVQSAGQLAGTLGLQAVGVPWFVTTGVTSFGSEAENALNEGASYGKAGLSAAISAGAEMLTEKLFGGSGLGETGMIAVDKLTKGISNKIVKAVADFGIDVLAEGSEEVISQIASNFGSALYKEEKLGEILFSEEAIDEYIESFIGGGVLGGVMNAGNLASSIRNKTDYRSGLNENEQKVVDKEVENRIAEQEQSGKKLTEKEKATIEEAVVRDMDRGYISTDTIEEVLGGESYQTYKQTVDSEDALLKEYEELGKKQNATLAEQTRYSELHQQVGEIKANSQRDLLKSTLTENVFQTVKNDRLAESYNERARRGQAFEADLTKYDTKQQETIKKAVESGILNNTNRTHEFVDMIAKISADKGVLFDFTNNEKLKESSFAVDGKFVNGYLDKATRTIGVNIDSAKALNTVVGHEVTHVLEGTELYDVLSETVIEYAKSKGEYQGRYDALSKLYEEKDIPSEMTADLVGEYLFTDEDFVRNLSVQHRNVFQKIYDEIKYLCKITTAGSKEARELEKVKRAFEKAYKESGKSVEGDTKYSISETTDGRFAAVVDSDILAKIDTSSWDDTKKEEAKKAATDALKQFSDGIVVDGITRKVNRTSRREYTRSKYTERLFKKAPEVFADKMRAAEVADDIVVAATDWSRDGGLNHPRTDNFVDFDHGKTLIVSGDAKYSAEVVVGITDTGEAVFYDVVDMTPATFDIKKEESPTTATTQNAIGDIQEDSFEPNVAQDGENVNYSLSDSDGKQLTKEQQEYFKDSVIRDKDGKLLPMYHGTDAKFTVFDINKAQSGMFDKGFYFTEHMGLTRNFGRKRLEVYLNVKKPLVFGKDDISLLGKDGYDAVINYDDAGAMSSVVVVSPEQIKLTDNTKPTSDPDIRYSLSPETDKAYLDAVKSGNMELAQQMVNEAAEQAGYNTNMSWKMMHSAPNSEDDISLVDLKASGLVPNDYWDHPEWYTYGAEERESFHKVKAAIERQEKYAADGKDRDARIWVYRAVDKTRNTKEDFFRNGDWVTPSYDYAVNEGQMNPEGYRIIKQNVPIKDLYWDGNSIAELGYDDGNNYAYADTKNNRKLLDPVTYDEFGQVIPLSKRFNKRKWETEYSLSEVGETPDNNGLAPLNKFRYYGKDMKLEDFSAPVADFNAESNTENRVGDMFLDDLAPIADDPERFDSLTDADAPAETEAESGAMGSPMTMPKSVVNMIAQNVRESLGLTNQQMADVHKLIEEYGKQEFPSREQLFEEVRKRLGTYTETTPDTDLKEIKKYIRKYRLQVSDTIKGDIADYNDFRRRNFGKIRFSREGIPVDVAYDELSTVFPGWFPKELINPSDQMEHIAEIVNLEDTNTETFDVPEETLWNVTDDIIEQVSDYQYGVMEKISQRDAKAAADYLAKHADEYAPEDIAPVAQETAAEQPKGTAQATQAEVSEKVKDFQTELENNIRLREQSNADFDREIARLRAEYDAKKNKNSIAANDILRRIERTQRMKNNVDNDYAKRISNLEEKIEKMNTPAYQTAVQRMAKHQEYAAQMESLIGDTTNWVDKKMGISYKINTLKRNLRDVVRKADGSRDIKKADAIYDELQGKYNHNEASLNREAAQIKQPYADLKITKAEDAYIQMLGELRHNPDTKLTTDVVNKYYEQHKNSIDKAKVDKIIADARKTYDSLLQRVNEVLKEQGMKEIPYRQGYFPHFTEEKQGLLAKLFNWKTRNDDIPTDIAGLTEQFNPNRSWQSFNKQRKGDTTDYSFTKGLDTYVQGALDWIYHIEDIQKRRAFENHIRYVHSEKGVQDKIDALRKNEVYDADELQEQIDLIYREAANPLNNFVTDLRAGTNRLANKKSSMDRGMEEATNRHFYSVMTNISNRVTANMVGGSVSSALTNFIPITQSWGEVSPVSSLRAMGDTIASTFRDDGMIDKSDFLTNRLRKADNLYKSGWDKVSDKVGLLMEGIDSFTSQTVWRSKYLENIANRMSESQAIKNADQFAEGVMAGRSRGNMPTIFESKNPLIKTLTAFQLEVNNQYGYMFKDMPQDMRNESVGKLVKGYAAMFIGAYAYNALYSSLTGRDAAFDPIGIIEDLLRDMGLFGDDEEEEPVDILMNLTDNILEETPFIGGLMGGGRIPISSALPYDGVYEALSGTMTDISEGDWSNLTNEWLNPLYYLALPVGGGQIRKTIQGLSMFSDDHPVAGSYTQSGNLRFPVEDTLGSRIKAGIFGQYASKNAREYFDNDYAPLKEKQIQEFVDLDIPISDYWKYREGLSGLSKLSEKADYIAGLDLPIDKKNLLINNIADREEDIDLTGYENYDSFDEFDFAVNNPEKYEIAKKVGGYEAYMKYREGMEGMKLEEKVDYVAGLNLTTAQKNALINGETDRKEPIDLTGYENYSSLEEMDYAKQHPENYAVAKAVGGYEAYRGYSSELYDIKADKDESGKSITGSRKEKVIEYINNLDADYGEKLILFKSEYNADDTYNYEIIDYLNSRDDISYDETVTILKKLGFTVDSDGNIYW